MTRIIVDTPTKDGTGVQRVITTTFPDGSTDVRTNIIPNTTYLALEAQVQSRVDDATAELTTIQENKATVQANQAKVNPQPLPPITPPVQ